MTLSEAEKAPPDKFETLKQERIQKRKDFKAQEFELLQKAAEILQKVALEEEHSEISLQLFQQVKNIQNILDFKAGISQEAGSPQEAQIFEQNQIPVSRTQFAQNQEAATAQSSTLYAKVAARGLLDKPDKLVRIQTSNSEKHQVFQKVSSNRDKRLILKLSSNFKAGELDLNVRLVRTATAIVNDLFFKHKEIDQPVLASIAKSFHGTTLILTTTADFTAEYLLQSQDLWKKKLEDTLEIQFKPERDSQWGKLVLHDIPIEIFNTEEGMSQLKHELEAFNHDFKLQRNPIWLDSLEKRQQKHNGSVLVEVKNPEQADRFVLYINRLRLRVYKYKENNRAVIQKQCSNCQRYGHLANYCTRNTHCMFCAKNHSSWSHKCQTSACGIIGKACEHTEPKCSNCQEKHFANAKECCFAPKLFYKKTENSQTAKETASQPSSATHEDVEMGLETPTRTVSKRKTVMTGSPTPVKSKVTRIEKLQRMTGVEIPVFKSN